MAYEEIHNSAIFYGHPASSAWQLAVFKDENDKLAAFSFKKILNETSSTKESSAASTPAESAGVEESHGFLSFLKTIVDVINPLQHIPVISALYRQVTGDEINPASRVAGDALYGGVIGAAIGIADVAFRGATGKDMGETVLTMIKSGKKQDAPVEVASSAVPQSDIVWDDQSKFYLTSFPSSPTPTTPYRTGMDGNNEPAAHSTPTAQPVFHEKDTRNADAGLTAAEADSTNVLYPQEVPAASARTAEPPGPIVEPSREQIAARMTEALDKYQAMQLASPRRPPLSATF